MIKIIKKQNYNSTILKNDLEFLTYEYPYFKIKNIGKTTLGEEIVYFKLGEGEKKLFINASHHANEWMTSLILMMFVEKYLQLYQKKEIYKGYAIKELWKKVSMYIVPMVNPDGVNFCLNNLKENPYEAMWKTYEKNRDEWKANIRGVDLKNYQPVCKVLQLLTYKTLHSLSIRIFIIFSLFFVFGH